MPASCRAILSVTAWHERLAALRMKLNTWFHDMGTAVQNSRTKALVGRAPQPAKAIGPTSQSRLGEWCYSYSLAALSGIENWVWYSEELDAMRAIYRERWWSFHSHRVARPVTRQIFHHRTRLEILPMDLRFECPRCGQHLSATRSQIRRPMSRMDLHARAWAAAAGSFAKVDGGFLANLSTHARSGIKTDFWTSGNASPSEAGSCCHREIDAGSHAKVPKSPISIPLPEALARETAGPRPQ